ncbi:hypothetical protein CEXT_619871 [Caerostris extrusa]|uniref:Uncharacterized protein n=1 Tax=Caerostris extrusa TaxID=172846 RepID=A0AAV4R143_CAEEX|nr:hypothetical protein CEXT_619871 [Caerostris extrusa]
MNNLSSLVLKSYWKNFSHGVVGGLGLEFASHRRRVFVLIGSFWSWPHMGRRVKKALSQTIKLLFRSKQASVIRYSWDRLLSRERFLIVV